MTTIRVLLVCLCGFFSVAYGSSFRSEDKAYVSRDDLKFGKGGIYIRTLNNTWAKIPGISCDKKGYYLAYKNLLDTYSACPACRYENVPDGKPCPRCGFPLSDDLPWKQ